MTCPRCRGERDIAYVNNGNVSPTYPCPECCPSVAAVGDKMRETEAWFDRQIANAQANQVAAFKISTAASQLAGEKAHARHCAMYEAKQYVLAALAQATPSRPVTAGARHAFDVHAYSDPADIDNHPLRHDPTRDLIESILFKRSLNKQLEGYALRTSLEIAIALAALSPQDGQAALPSRETLAKAMHSRRYQMDAKDTDSMFAWYAENPQGTDRSRMAIYQAFRDADAVLAVLAAPTLLARTVRRRVMMTPDLLEAIEKIDHLLNRDEQDSGYQAFVYMRKIWPQLKAAALPASAPEDMAAHIKRLEAGLLSISKNTCCDNCQEAALVARAALASYIGLAEETNAACLPFHQETMAGLNSLTLRHHPDENPQEEFNEVNDAYARGEHVLGVTK